MIRKAGYLISLVDGNGRVVRIIKEPDWISWRADWISWKAE